MLRIAVAPCSPFSVTDTLLEEAAALARDKGVRLHTHLAETMDEDAFCRERFGCGPVDYMDSLGWLGPDVWYGHGIHLATRRSRRWPRPAPAVAHCPSSNARLGAGIGRVRDLRDAGVPVGLGVDGAASNEASSLLEEARHALLFARARGGPRPCRSVTRSRWPPSAAPGSSAGTTRSVRWSPASRPTSPSGASTPSRTSTSSTPSRDSYSATAPRSSCCSSAGGRSSTGASSSTSTRALSRPGPPPPRACSDAALTAGPMACEVSRAGLAHAREPFSTNC